MGQNAQCPLEHNPYLASSSPSSSANRPSRRRTSHIPGPDPVDRLGAIGSAYHHDGPFEATLLARQIPGRAPVDAVRDSNAAALAATPLASIRDCLDSHYPLRGVAMYPPGVGGTGNYDEYDVMVRDGAYRRWPHMDYHDDDRKGKGEPSFTADELDKRRKQDRGNVEAGAGTGTGSKDKQPRRRQEVAGAAAAPSKPGGGSLSRLRKKVRNSLKESGRL